MKIETRKTHREEENGTLSQHMDSLLPFLKFARVMAEGFLKLIPVNEISPKFWTDVDLDNGGRSTISPVGAVYYLPSREEDPGRMTIPPSIVGALIVFRYHSRFVLVVRCRLRGLVAPLASLSV